MLTAVQPDLPTIPPSTQLGGGSVIERLDNAEKAIQALLEDRRRLIEAMRGMWDTLNQDGVLDIVQARINGTNIGDVVAGTGAFTTLSASGLISANGGQVKFPSAQNASADANTLDDYEEGTFTAGLAFGGGTTGITYSIQAGHYTKIGRHVFCTGQVALTSKGSSTGSATITGLPFTVGTISTASLVTDAISFANQMMASAPASGTTISLLESTEAGVLTALDDTNFANTSSLAFAMHYRV